MLFRSVISAWVVTEILNLPFDKELVNDITLGVHRHLPQVVLVNPDPNFNKKFRIIFDAVKKKVPSTGPGVYHEYINNNPKDLDVMALIIGNMITGPGSLAGALQYLTLDLYHENQLDILINNKALIPAAVDESLRYRAAVGRFCRTVTKEITMHGINFKPGDRVAISLESANRDPKAFKNPDQFIIGRKEAKHLSWGHGVHACIALMISKEMLSIYLKLLLDNIGKYEILTKPSELNYSMMVGGNINNMTNIMLKKL